MGFKNLLTESPMASFGKRIQAAPREVIFNRNLILTTILYASAAIPATWDQGMASAVPTLPGFQQHFGISSGSNAKAIRNFVSIVYIGYATGSLVSFFINDRLGRLWSYRLYLAVWALGQIVATLAPGLGGLYASRIITGIGIGALTVTGPMAIVEIAPPEIRGLLTAWFTVSMSVALVSADFCVYGVFKHVSTSRLQYQIVFFSPCVFLFFAVIASFFLCESPRWLCLLDRHDDAVRTLERLRGLPASHPRMQQELSEIQQSIALEKEHHGAGNHNDISSIIKETFLVPSNLRRVQQTFLSYALAQLSGASSVTSYFIPILKIMGVSSGGSRSIFLSAMYAVSKLVFSTIASFLFIDVLGRRKSLFIGIATQMVTDIYIGIYIKFKQEGDASAASSRAALALIFIHAFGYAVGLLSLPYVFGAELWPNRIRSFGGALSQSFHWLFIYAMTYGVPSLLANTNNWGAFIFFASWCFIALIYVYVAVPELAGLSVEDIDVLFKGPWFNAYTRSKPPTEITTVDGESMRVIS
ncbi:general substrate transporter [Exophiala viscosa]|uniref:General substrate transporter n=1 Tax=Exophiala viscosa TaxID=2486360 RepID=A0AAN6DWI5_9EURO|nr:general substrate transporter [Exophiala viscosa]